MENWQGFVASRRFLTAMAVCFIALPILVILIPGIHQESSISDLLGRLYKPHPVGVGAAHNQSNPHPVGEGATHNQSNAHHLSDDPHPVEEGVAQNESKAYTSSDDGLYAPGFDEKSCLSRFQSRRYRKSGRKPSAYLLSKLRSYEHRHRRCGIYTDSYNRTLQVIRSGKDINVTSIGSSGSSACKYLIWHPVNGLGNRMISLASTFLYALLTDRVLLADLTEDMADLFCEPFLGSSWILPPQFPLRDLARSGEFRFHHSVGKALKSGALKGTPQDSLPKKAPPFLFLNLYHGKYAEEPCSFYCDENQSFLRSVPCLSLLSDQYFVPSLFLIKPFKEEAIKLFPEKEAVFHHVVHYLMNPSNQAWGLITRYYEANLAKANERIGLQVRVFENQFIPLLTDKILTCLQNQTHLSKTNNQKPENSSSSSPRNQTTTTKAVLIASLYPQFYQNLSTIYSNKQTVSGEVIKFYQASHEGKQKFGDSDQNIKALVEIYLLSMCEKLVISADSTFGYVAQGLGVTRAWILLRPGYGYRDSCVRDLSIDPCFQWPPPFKSYDVDRNNNNGSSRNGESVAYLKHCEDWKSGVKLVDVHQQL